MKRIQQAAISIIEKDGLPRLSSNRIAAVAGVSIGTVYKFFPNKQAILASVVAEWSKEREKAIEEVRNLEPSASLTDRVELWFRHMTYTSASQVAMMTRALRYYPELREIDEAYQKRATQLVEEALIRDGCQLQASDLRKSARRISALGSHLLGQIHEATESDRKEAVQWALRMMRTAIADAHAPAVPANNSSGST